MMLVPAAICTKACKDSAFDLYAGLRARGVRLQNAAAASKLLEFQTADAYRIGGTTIDTERVTKFSVYICLGANILSMFSLAD